MKMEKMLKYQEIDGKIRKIIYELNHSEEAVNGKKVGLILKGAEEKLTKMARRSETIMASFDKMNKTYQDNIKKFDEVEKSIDQATDKVELNYLTKKLDDVKKNMVSMEKELAKLIEEMSDICNKYEDIRKTVPKAKEEYKNYRAKYDEKRKEKEPEVTQLKTELESLEKEISPEVMSTYQKLRSQKIYPVIVPLTDGNKCGGCRMEVSIGAMGKLNTDKFTICDNCQRLIIKQD